MSRAIEHLMQSDRFCQLFNRIDDSISIFELEECDLPGKLVEYNETMLHRLGYSPEELRDLSLEKIFAPENAEMVAEFIRRLQLYRHVLIDLIEITKTGERIPVEINARFIEFEERQVLMVISRNTALREEMEEKLVYIIEQVGEAHLQTQILSRRLVAAQEEERRKIAMELHDEIGQSLIGLKLILEIAQRERHGETFQMLGTARQMVDELMGKISHLSLDYDRRCWMNWDCFRRCCGRLSNSQTGWGCRWRFATLG